MLKRSCPRLSTASSTANGSSLTVTLSTLPVKNASSSWSVPRAIVPSTSRRALEPSAKNSLARSPRYFGWLCMSWRHAPSNAHRTRTSATLGANRDSRFAIRDSIEPRTASCEPRTANRDLRFNITDFPRTETLQERARAIAIELRVVRLDGQKKSILAGVHREPFDIEDRVIRHGQSVQAKHAEHRRKCRKEDRQLERHRHEHRPAQIRASTDVQWIRNGRDPHLKPEAGAQTGQSAEQHE